jgi:hypothetical protein
MNDRSNDAAEGDSVNGSHCGEHQRLWELELETFARKVHESSSVNKDSTPFGLPLLYFTGVIPLLC